MHKERIVLSGLINAVLPILVVAAFLACASISRAGEDDPYSQDVEKMSDGMTTLDCARCHYEIFTTIKKGQGAHRIPCRDCHTTFHSFQKGLRYEDVLPKCSNCHDKPHGDSEAMTACANCHSVPHAPLASLELKTLKTHCADCHTDAGTRMAKGRSAHSQLQCVFCHSDRHGTIPACEACHGTPHAPALTRGFAGCLDCHGNPHDLALRVDESSAGSDKE